MGNQVGKQVQKPKSKIQHLPRTDSGSTNSTNTRNGHHISHTKRDLGVDNIGNRGRGERVRKLTER